MNRNARLLASALSVTLLFSATTYVVLGRQDRIANAPIMANKILVFSSNLDAGHILTGADVRWVRSSAGSGANADFIQSEQDRLTAIGARLSQAVVATEAVRKSYLSPKRTQGLLSERLNSGFRALTISTDTSQLASGRLLPGDHVDVLLTPSGTSSGGALALPALSAPAAVPANVTRLYENVRVLAISGATEPEDPAAGKMDSSLLKDATITLELRPDQAERVLAAAALGKIVLLLRRPFDPVGEVSSAPSPRPRIQLQPVPAAPASPAPIADPALSPAPAVPQGVIIIRGTN